jgi:hypothetical protein
LNDCLLPNDLGPITALNRLRQLELRGCRTVEGRQPDLHTLAHDTERGRLVVEVDRGFQLPAPIPGVRVKHL